MLPDASLFFDRINLITGPSAGSGKTMFAQAAAIAVRAAGGNVAMLSAGAEGFGGTRQQASARRAQAPEKSLARLRRGDVFVTADAFLESATCLPEILDVVPGMSALGRLAIARAGRSGSTVLVGPERNEFLAAAAGRIVEEGWARTVIIDGSLNRMTQIATIQGARLFYAVRASQSDYMRTASKMNHLLHLLELPVSEGDEGQAGFIDIEGPLTQSIAEGIPEGARAVRVGDFSKIFLDGSECAALEKRLRLCVRRKVDFGGFSVVLRGVSGAGFIEAAGPAAAGKVVSWNAYACEPAFRVTG